MPGLFAGVLMVLIIWSGSSAPADAQGAPRGRSDALFEPWRMGGAVRPAGRETHAPRMAGRHSAPAARALGSPFYEGSRRPLASPDALPVHLRRQVVPYATREPPGTIVVDTTATYLYLVIGDGQALRYGIGVGREGFTWSGRQAISRLAEWPDWRPPREMIARQPELPDFMPGGLDNPLGARALYLGNTLYRIHGTNEPSSIGTFSSSGCIRMLNDDVIDLYGRVTIGTTVVVLPPG